MIQYFKPFLNKFTPFVFGVISLSSCYNMELEFYKIDRDGLTPTISFHTTKLAPYEQDSGLIQLQHIDKTKSTCNWKRNFDHDFEFDSAWNKLLGKEFVETHKNLLDSSKQVYISCDSITKFHADLMCYTICSDGNNKYGCYSSSWTGIAKDHFGGNYKIRVNFD